MQLSLGKYTVWYGDTQYHAIHAKKRGRIALVIGGKAAKEVVDSVNSCAEFKQQRDELLAALKELRSAEWMVTHDWGGDRQSINNKIDALIAKADLTQ